MKVLGVTIDIPEKYGKGLAPREGRVITLEFDDFYLINSYIPNSGDGLVRLDFRVKEWYVLIISLPFFFPSSLITFLSLFS